MPFDIRLTREDLDGLPETVAITDLYEEQEGGGYRFVPKIEGMKPQSELDKVMEALRKEKNDHKTVKERFRAFGEREPDEILQQLDQIDELKAQLEAAAGNTGISDEKLEELVEKRLARVKAPLERELAKITTERDEAVQSGGSLKEKLDDLIIGQHLDELADKHCDPAVKRDVKEIGRFYLAVNDDGEVVTKDESPLPASEWLQNQLQDRDHWNKPTGNGGGGRGNAGKTGRKNNPFSAENVNWSGMRPTWNPGALTAQDKLRSDEGIQAYEAAARAAGVDPSLPGSFPPRPA